MKAWVKHMKRIKRCKLPVIKQISPGNVIYNMVTALNNTILHISKLLRKKFLEGLITRKKNYNYVQGKISTRLTA